MHVSLVTKLFCVSDSGIVLLCKEIQTGTKGIRKGEGLPPMGKTKFFDISMQTIHFQPKSQNQELPL